MPYQCAALLVRSLHTYTHYIAILSFVWQLLFSAEFRSSRERFAMSYYYTLTVQNDLQNGSSGEKFCKRDGGTVVDRFTMQIYANSDLIRRPLPPHARVVLEVSDSFVFHDTFILFVVSRKVYYNIIIQDESYEITIFLYYTFMY